MAYPTAPVRAPAPEFCLVFGAHYSQGRGGSALFEEQEPPGDEQTYPGRCA